MSPIAIIVINLALLFYSIGVWRTGLMFDYVGGMSHDIHGYSGVLAIVLMFVHAIWATVVLVKKDEKMIANFHKFSIAVWVIWLIPYSSPMVLKMVEAGR
jgi:uncharacterized repeat protein (TIGR03987 family)